MTRTTYTDDAQVTLLLCSHLAMPKSRVVGGLQPLSPQEWNDLAGTLRRRRLRPGALLAMDAPAMKEQLGLGADQNDRIVQLLSRGAQLAVELERLGSLGIWALTRSDEQYPARFKDHLGAAAPAVLFGAGALSLLEQGFLAVVGSRDIDEAGKSFATQIGSQCARSGLVLVSGGARGVDSLSMQGCLRAGGSVVGVVADSLERAVRDPESRQAIIDGRLTLISAVHPKAGFSVGAAMMRNKYIYCLARCGLVVASSLEKGGTRAGALEVIRDRWVPLFVRSGEGVPVGNADLIKRGALPFPAEQIPDDLAAWLSDHAQPWGTPMASRRKSLAGPSPSGAGVTEEDDLFPVVWPHIAQRLGRWRSHEEMAHSLNVSPEQLQAWIAHAVHLGLISRADAAEKRVAGGPAVEQSRFDM